MKERGVSQLPVLDEGRLVGIVTESDLLGKLVEGRASLSSTVAEVMFRNVGRRPSSRSAVQPRVTCFCGRRWREWLLILILTARG
jgi:CBS domain-containing protein